MGLPLNFRNILNLFNIIDYSEYFTSTYTIDQNVSIFTDAVEGYYGDGLISLDELKNFSNLTKFPEYMIENMFTASDTDSDGFLSTTELTNLFSSFDADGNNSLDWSEGQDFYNAFSSINIPSSTTFTQYSRFLATSQSTYNVYDTDGDFNLDLTEYDTLLQEMGIDDGGATAANMINLYDTNGDGSVSFEEMLVQNIDWDTNQNGIIDYSEGEASDLIDLIPWYLKPSDTMTKIEQIAASLILYNDADQNKELGYDELKNYLVNIAAFPVTMVDEMAALYSGGDNSFTFDELAAMYSSFDADSDDELTYEELMNFQNTILDIDIDTSQVTETQYGGLYQMGAQYIKSYDGDGDGEISVKEYRAAIKQVEDSYKSQDMEVPDNIGQYLAENFVRLFDMDKNGTVSVIEIINQYSLIDINKDGKISGGENIDLQLRMEDSRLWENVNEDYIKVGDTDYDRELSLTEFQNVLIQKGLPQYIADDAFTMFDLNANGLLSHLELMEAYSRYDGSAVNYAYIESVTGTPYILYTGNANQTLDAHERFQMYEDLAAADAAGLSYTPNPALAAQYEKIYAASKEIIDGYDSYKDGVLTSADYKKYFKDKGLPEYLADAVIAAYDLSGDSSYDLLENIQMNLDYDINQNGILDFEEEFKLYDDITGIGLNISELNKLQYKNIYDNAKNFINQYDVNLNNALNQDGALQIDEMEKFFRGKGLPDDYANLALAAFDVNADGGLDILEWMKAYADFDTDGNGILGQHEELMMFDSIAGTALPNITDSARYNTLQNTITSLIQNYDLSDNDKKLNNIELYSLMKNLGLPDYIADEAITAYDLNGDGGIDKMEWMSAYTTVDHNENGTLEFNEEIELYSTLSGATLIPLTEDDINQYSSLYNSLKTFFAQNDNTTDRILTPDELESYFTDLELPAYMATEVINMYDVNGDGGVDIYEWMEPHLLFDINKNGKLDFNELMGLNAILADPDLPIDPNTMNEVQVTNLYNYSKNFIANLDTEFNDSKISENELIKYYKTIGLSDNIASAVIASQDTNADGYLDMMEWLNTSLLYDVNSTGVLEFNELMNLYQDATGVALNTTDTNIKQHQSLYNYASRTINTIDADDDKKLSASEFKTWLTNSYGITDDMANQIISHYDSTIGDGDGLIDQLEFTKSLIDVDVNGNGGWETLEMMNYFDNALPAVDLGGVDEDNFNQYWNLYSYAIQNINAFGGGDKIFTPDELKNWIKNNYAITDDMADQVINTYGGADGMDALEFAQALINLDANTNGKWDYAEQINFFDNASGDILANVDADNSTQYWNLYNYAIRTLNQFAGNDKLLSSAELKTWLGNAYALTDDMTNQIINHYGGADGINALELTRALVNLDANGSGGWDVEEQINFLDDGFTDALPPVDTNNVQQYWGLYSYAIQNTNAFAGSDKKFDADEFKTWVKKTYALSDEMANQVISQYGGADGMDAIEFADALIDLDANANGKWDYAEQMNFFDNALPAVNLGGIDSNNVNQYWSLYGYAINTVNSFGGDDKKLTSAELSNWIKNNYALTDDMANQIINSYDLDSDGQMDTMEFTQALAGLDTNANGRWDTEEQMNFIDDGSSNILGPVDADNVAQYWSLYTYSIQTVNRFAGTDKKFNSDEFKTWLKNAYALTDDMVNQILSHYGGADGIDALELASALINLDANGSRGWDISEQINFFDDALPAVNLGVVDDDNSSQYWGLYSYAIQNTNAFAGTDKEFTSSEFRYWLKDTYAMTDDMAAQIVNSYDLNANGQLDAMELTQALLNLDTNANGKWDTAEQINFLDDGSTNLLANVDDLNVQQYWNLYSYAIQTINSLGGSDKKLSPAEFKNWLKNNYALTDDMANQIINTYGGADGMDALEFANALINLDINSNGKWDTAEQINFIDDGFSDALGPVDEDNVTQYWNLYSYAIQNTNAFAGSDKKFSDVELKNWLKNVYKLTDDMASQIVSHYGGADGMDAIEFADALINLDVNANGKWDKEEQLNFIDAAMPAVNLGGVTEANVSKYWSLFGTAMNTVNLYDIDKDNMFSADEYKVYLKGQGLPEYLADGIIAGFDLNGDNLIDAMEYTQLTANIDSNNTGSLEFYELMSYYKALAAAAPGGYTFSFNPDVTTSYQLNNAYANQLNLVRSNDTSYDQKLQASEYEQVLLRAGFADAATMAANAVANFDRNGDGAIDVFEWMDAVLSFDDNDNGLLDGDELTNFYNSL